MKTKEIKKIVFICNGKDCKKNGAGKIRKELKNTIESEKLKGDIRMVKCECLDLCSKGPVAIFNRTLFTEIQVNDVGQILEQMK